MFASWDSLVISALQRNTNIRRSPWMSDFSHHGQHVNSMVDISDPLPINVGHKAAQGSLRLPIAEDISKSRQ